MALNSAVASGSNRMVRRRRHVRSHTQGPPRRIAQATATRVIGACSAATQLALVHAQRGDEGGCKALPGLRCRRPVGGRVERHQPGRLAALRTAQHTGGSLWLHRIDHPSQSQLSVRSDSDVGSAAFSAASPCTSMTIWKTGRTLPSMSLATSHCSVQTIMARKRRVGCR